MTMRFLSSSRRLAHVGLFGAMAAVLSLLESAIPVPSVPGVRLGLANVAVTAALYLLGPVNGVLVAAVKVLFVLLTRGVPAALMSGVGTLLAVLMTAALLPLYRREKLTFVGIGVASAAVHMSGQLLTASLLLGRGIVSMAPLLLVLSVPAGMLTGLCLNVLIPRLSPLLRQRF